MRNLLIILMFAFALNVQAQDIDPICMINDADWVGVTTNPDTGIEYLFVQISVSGYTKAMKVLVDNSVKARQNSEIKVWENPTPGTWNKLYYHVVYDSNTRLYTFDGFEELRTYSRIADVRTDIRFLLD